MRSSRLSPLTAIFITVMVDMFSFGVVIPDLQIRGKALGLSGLALGAVMMSFSLAQLLVSPLAGRLSDGFGRRPVILIGAVMNCLSFVAYAYASNIPMFFVARVLGGCGASNLSAAYAYVADATPPEQRTRAMGIIGAAFGIGFIFGPAIGGLIVHFGGQFWLGMFSAALAAGNALFVFFVLREVRHADGQSNRFSFSLLAKTLRVPGLIVLLLMFFSFNFAFSNLESTFVLFANRKYGFEQLQAGLFLGYIGVLIAIVQGGLIGVLVKRVGETRLVRLGMSLVVLALLTMPFMPTWPILMVNGLFLCFGSGITTPSLGSLVSQTAAASIQGGIFGITQALGALARICGPLSGQTLFEQDISYPYIFAACVTVIPILLGLFALRTDHLDHIREHSVSQSTTE